MAKLKITLKRSPIGYNESQKRTVRALGLRKLHHSVIHEDSPTVRGMIAKVVHLVQVEVQEEQVDNAKKRKAPTRTPKTSPQEASPLEEEASQPSASAPLAEAVPTTEAESTEHESQEVSS